MLLTARFVVPVEGPVIEGGAVIIRDGRIERLTRASSLVERPTVDYDNAVILPGLVNAHTHFELGFLAGKVAPQGDFVDWLRRLVQLLIIARPTQAVVSGAAARAVAESLTCGVTCVGDITRWPAWTRPVLAGSRLRAVSFGEVIATGAGRERLAERLEAAASSECQTDRLICAISPHSPYTVEPAALRACAARAADMKVPLCVHAAESPDEAEFTAAAAGRLADFLREVGVWDDGIAPTQYTPVALLASCGVLGPRTILAHANYVSDADLTGIAQSGASVAYCPRTHAAFGHAPHRFRDMLRAGINVAIGTDSLASNPSLSVLGELRFLHATYPDFDVDELLAMGTLRGARALGLEDEVGSLVPGKSADLVVLPLPSGARGWERVLHADAGPMAVYVGGVQTSLRGKTQERSAGA